MSHILRALRISLWEIVSHWEAHLYPYHDEEEDYYYKVKNDETGEEYMMIEWVKSFDERIQRLQDEMIFSLSEIRRLSEENVGTTNNLYEIENKLESMQWKKESD